MQDFNTIIAGVKTQLATDNDAGKFTPVLRYIDEWTHLDGLATNYPAVTVMVTGVDYDPDSPENAMGDLELWVYVSAPDSRYAQQQVVQLATAVGKRIAETHGGVAAQFYKQGIKFRGWFGEGGRSQPIAQASIKFRVLYKESRS